MKAKAQAFEMDESGLITSPSGAHPAAASPLTLLIHGYENDEHDAADSFYRMRSNLDNVLWFAGRDEADRKLVQSSIWEFYWPGYLRLPRLPLLNPEPERRSKFARWISAFSYGRQVTKARDSVSKGLFKYLRRVRPSAVFFVAHSLGCRVALETARHLLESWEPGPDVSGFLLMAGAIPIDKLQEVGTLGPTARVPRRRYCLYSWRDIVLMAFFPPGQLSAGEIPPYGMPVATGLTGLPVSLWNLRANTRLGHGDYWKRGLFVQKECLAELTAGIFGVAISRTLPVLNLPESPSALVASILPESHLASGNLPGSDWLKDLYGPQS